MDWYQEAADADRNVITSKIFSGSGRSGVNIAVSGVPACLQTPTSAVWWEPLDRLRKELR